jgi:hypothetical protein
MMDNINMSHITIKDVHLDSLIQECVMGWKGYYPFFNPSTNIKHAYELEQKLYELGFQVLTKRCTGSSCGLLRWKEAEEGDFFCNVSKNSKEGSVKSKSVAKTLQRAICYSALKAVGCENHLY